MSTVGILGGGQLARMLALSGAPLGVRFLVVDSVSDACASQVAPLLQADWRDFAALEEFARRIDVATFDFENVPAETAQWLTAHTTVYPNPRALSVAQDRLAEKTLFQDVGLATPAFAAVDSLDDLQRALVDVGYPAVLKTRRLGYDGKGQYRIKSPADVAPAWEALGRVPLIVEAFVPFEREVSVIGVRARDGEFRTYPLTQNWHADVVECLGDAARSRWSCSCTKAVCSATKWRRACTTPGTGPSRARRRVSSRTTCARCSGCRSAIPRRSASM